MYFSYTPVMQTFNLTCVYCKNQLLECGLLLGTPSGPFVACDVCRGLYYIEIVNQTNGKAMVVIQPTGMDQDAEFEIIRYAESRVPLAEYLPKLETEKEEKNLKSIIKEATTPSDFIRKLHDN